MIFGFLNAKIVQQQCQSPVNGGKFNFAQFKYVLNHNCAAYQKMSLIIIKMKKKNNQAIMIYHV